MKLYYSKGACSLAVRIIIHELNLSSEFIAVDLKNKKTASGSDYLKINPKGSVPTVELDNHEILTENAVIMQYLADTHKATSLLPPVGDMKRYRVLEWTNYITTEIHKSFGPFFSANYPEDFRKNVLLPLLEKKFLFIENQLKNQGYLIGENFTLPDAYLFVMLRWLTPVAKISLDQFPNLKRYFEALKKYKSIEIALTEEGLG